MRRVAHGCGAPFKLLAALPAAQSFQRSTPFSTSECSYTSKEVSPEDVQAFMSDGGFGRGGPKPLAAARTSNLFNRGNLEE